jgi:hypothetical protein
MADRLDPKVSAVPTTAPSTEGDADRRAGALLIGILGAFGGGAAAWAGELSIGMIIGAAILGYVVVAALAWFLWARESVVQVGYGVTILLVNAVAVGAVLMFKPVDLMTTVALLVGAAISLWIGVWWIRRGMRAGGIG